MIFVCVWTHSVHLIVRKIIIIVIILIVACNLQFVLSHINQRQKGKGSYKENLNLILSRHFLEGIDLIEKQKPRIMVGNKGGSKVEPVGAIAPTQILNFFFVNHNSIILPTLKSKKKNQFFPSTRDLIPGFHMWNGKASTTKPTHVYC